MITINNLHKSYGHLHVLRGINLHIAKGEVVSLMGASGAGKTTLLHITGTLDRGDNGNVIIDGCDTQTLSISHVARFRNLSVGFVFQFHHLLPEFTALENICMPALISGRNQNDAISFAKEILAYLGLKDRINHKPSELSGGEQQRVAVARALINKPKIILADEPSGNLDSANAASLHHLFFDLRKEFGQTFFIATHNEQFAAMADRKLTIKDGIIIN